MAVLLLLIYRQAQQKGDIIGQWAELRETLYDSPIGLILAVVLLAPANWMLEARKWQLLLQKIEPKPFYKALASTLTGIAFSIVTPNKIGDFAGRILYLEDKNKLRAAIATLVSNLAQTIVTSLFGIIGLVYFNISYPALWPKILLGLGIGMGGLLMIGYFRLDRISRWAGRRKWLKKAIIPIKVLQRYSKKDLTRLLALSALRFTVYNVQFLILANLLGAQLPWWGGLLVTGLMFWMIAVIPSLFLADLGVRGFVAGLLFVQNGMAANGMSILAASYCIWALNLLLPAIVGSLLLLTTKIFR